MISIAGSLIYFEEKEDTIDSSLALYQNVFNNIHTYIGPGVLDVRRNYTTVGNLKFD
jgi:hypothetical protein